MLNAGAYIGVTAACCVSPTVRLVVLRGGVTLRQACSLLPVAAAKEALCYCGSCERTVAAKAQTCSVFALAFLGTGVIPVVNQVLENLLSPIELPHAQPYRTATFYAVNDGGFSSLSGFLQSRKLHMGRGAELATFCR